MGIERQQPVPVIYKSKMLVTRYAWTCGSTAVLVECKAVSEHNKLFESQLLTTAADGLKLGLVINFGNGLSKTGSPSGERPLNISHFASLRLGVNG